MIEAIELARLIEDAGGMDTLRKDPDSGLWIVPTVPATLITFRALDAAEKVLMVKAARDARR